MLIQQNFSVAKGNDLLVDLDIGPDSPAQSGSLLGSNLTWRAYPQESGVPTGEAVIVKNLDNGLQITDPEYQIILITLARADTINLALGNYWHEASLDDTEGNHTTVTEGIMTLVRAENPVLTV